MPVIYRNATDQDRREVRALQRLAFGGDAEAQLVDTLHEDGDVRLSHLAELNSQIVGHILFSELQIASPSSPPLHGLSLAPLAVHPDHQGQGIGTRLTRCSLEQLRRDGWGWIVVVGDPAFYGRFGFRAESARHLRSPYAGEFCLALDLQSDSREPVCGELVYPAAFSRLT